MTCKSYMSNSQFRLCLFFSSSTAVDEKLGVNILGGLGGGVNVGIEEAPSRKIRGVSLDGIGIPMRGLRRME